MTTSSSPETLEQATERLALEMGCCNHLPHSICIGCREFTLRSAMRLFAESAIGEQCQQCKLGNPAIAQDSSWVHKTLSKRDGGHIFNWCDAVAIRRLAEELNK